MLQPSAPAREPTAWIHAPSQPLMRSLLSQFQTPTAPRRVSRFFRVWLPHRSPRRADHSAYFGVARFISPILSAVDGNQTKQLRHLCQRKIWQENEISVHGIVEKRARSKSFVFPRVLRRLPSLPICLAAPHRSWRNKSTVKAEKIRSRAKRPRSGRLRTQIVMSFSDERTG